VRRAICRYCNYSDDGRFRFFTYKIHGGGRNLRISTEITVYLGNGTSICPCLLWNIMCWLYVILIKTIFGTGKGAVRFLAIPNFISSVQGCGIPAPNREIFAS